MRWNENGQWDKVIFSDESQVVLGANKRIFIWRRKDEAESPDCVCPPAQRKVSVMIWGCITWHGVGTITTVDGTINRHKYIEILENNLWPVIARVSPTKISCFKMTMPLYTEPETLRITRLEIIYILSAGQHSHLFFVIV